MLDMNNPRDRITAAAMRLAEKRGWSDLSLGEIAAEAGMPLAELSREFQSKAKILAYLSRKVDQAVLEKFPAPGADAPRDRIFDVIITRFEIMQPYKAALKRIRADLGANFGAGLSRARPALRSQYWMLAAAGISGEGGIGLLRVQGLLAVYARVFSIWLDDDDPGMAQTMAALDSRLRRGESAIRRMESVRGGLANMFRAFRGEREAPSPSGAEEPGAQTPNPQI